MINGSFIGFVCVASIAVAFADYANQAKVAGSSITDYPISTYTDSISIRFAEARAAKELARRQAEPVKTHLPEAPKGWERREWVRDHEAEYQADLEKMTPFARKAAQRVREGMTCGFTGRIISPTIEAALDSQIWEYVREDEVIRLNAMFANTDVAKGIQGLAMEMVSPDKPKTIMHAPYGVIQGVPFFEVMSSDWTGRAMSRPDTIRDIELIAQMGDAIRIQVTAHASDVSIRTLLELVDIDNLNLMLDTPLTKVGTAAPDLSPDEEIAVAAAALAVRYGTQGTTKSTFKAKVQKLAEAVASKEPALGQSVKVKAREKNNPSGAKSGDGSAKAAAQSTNKAQGDVLADQPKRIKLSGGKTCLEGSTGRFCKK